METINFFGQTIIEFYELGCLNCQSMTPVINYLERIRPDINFYRVQIKDYPNLVQKYQIKSLPTLLIFRNGQMLSKIVGLKTPQVLLGMIDRIFSYA